MAAVAAKFLNGKLLRPVVPFWVRSLRSVPFSSSHLYEFATVSSYHSFTGEDCSDIQPVNSRKEDPLGENFLKIGKFIELVCESLAFMGRGICKVPGSEFVILCRGALPGERFIGRIARKKSNYAEALKVRTISPHSNSVDAPCELALHCGGCTSQNLLYQAQLQAKEHQVHDLIVNVGKFSTKDLELLGIMKPIVACDVQFNYRNKMEFSFRPKKWVPYGSIVERQYGTNNYALGLHVPSFFDKILNVNKCFLQSDPANVVLQTIQDCWRNPEFGLSPFDIHRHSGFLKYLVLRSGRNVKTSLSELMVNLVTSTYNPEMLRPIVEKISVIPEVVSIVNNINTKIGNTSAGECEYTLYGKSTINEILRGVTFQISANSFFPTNPRQAEVLYGIIENFAGLKGDGSEVILDLFCGTGTIGLTLARKVKHVYGCEVVDEAISDARLNAELNNISNATFFKEDLYKITSRFGTAFPKPDIVISDPSSPGMCLCLINFLLKLRAPRIIYVSCNLATCARDLHYLCHLANEKSTRGCYKLRCFQPVDMFPHTPQIDCVCLLELD